MDSAILSNKLDGNPTHEASRPLGHGTHTVKNPLGFVTEFDEDGHVSSVRSPLEDLGGGMLGEIPDVTRTTSVVRNSAGLPIRYVNADGTATVIGYRNSDVLGDAEQFPMFIRDESGRERHFDYFDDGRLAWSTDLAGNKTFFTHEDIEASDGIPELPNGGSREVVDVPGPGAVTYLYNEDGRLVKIDRPGFGDYLVTQFNEDSQPEVVTLPSGETVTMEYDPDTNRLISRTVTGGAQPESATFTYNANDAIDLIDDNTGTTTYTYYNDSDNQQDPGVAAHAGKLQKIVYPNGTSVEYKYDALGRVKTLITKPDDTGMTQYETTYEYNELGLLWRVWDPFNPQGVGGSQPTEYEYDEAGRLKNRTLPNGVYTTWMFDNRDRLKELAHYEFDGGPVLTSFTYEHPMHAVGEPHRITRKDSTGEVSYVKLVYDDALRLQSEDYYIDAGVLGNEADDTHVRTIAYTYDEQGNRTSRTVTGQLAEAYKIDGTSGYQLQRTAGPDGVLDNGDDAVYGYDAAGGGRLVSIDRGTDDWTLTYNSSGQVTEVLRDGESTLSYTYDALGRRTGAVDGTTERDYLVAPAAQRLGAGVLDVEVQHLATNAVTGALVNGWVYAGENPILRFEGAPGAEVVSYYLEDASDSVAALLNAGGAVVAEYEYDAFGNSLNGMNPTSAAGGDFGYHGAWRDAETGLYHMRARAYDPQTGRFTSPDPVEPVEQLAETYEPYSFANNNPHLYSDATGMFSITEINVGSAIRGTLRATKQTTIRYAKESAKDAIYEFATEALIQGFASLLPGGFVANIARVAANASAPGATRPQKRQCTPRTAILG